jgi:hypothetical protein
MKQIGQGVGCRRDIKVQPARQTLSDMREGPRAAELDMFAARRHRYAGRIVGNLTLRVRPVPRGTALHSGCRSGPEPQLPADASASSTGVSFEGKSMLRPLESFFYAAAPMTELTEFDGRPDTGVQHARRAYQRRLAGNEPVQHSVYPGPCRRTL